MSWPHYLKGTKEGPQYSHHFQVWLYNAGIEIESNCVAQMEIWTFLPLWQRNNADFKPNIENELWILLQTELKATLHLASIDILITLKRHRDNKHSRPFGCSPRATCFHGRLMGCNSIVMLSDQALICGVILCSCSQQWCCVEATITA